MMDAKGTLYGTTYYNGSTGYGTAYKIGLSGGTWVLTSLYTFGGLLRRLRAHSLVYRRSGNAKLGIVAQRDGTEYEDKEPAQHPNDELLFQ